VQSDRPDHSSYETHHSYEESPGRNSSTDGYGYEVEVKEEAQDADLTLSHSEMTNQWSKLNELRLDCELCDVRFSVRGEVFPAHRVVLSCCSRWLRSLLATTEGGGVIILDSLDPAAFEIIIGYLYGEPLKFTPTLSEELIRVIRTFELEDLEVRCWKYLVRSVTRKNCVWLHRLADAYDCPALKWEAWNVIKAVLSQFSLQPMQVLGAPLEDEDEEYAHRFSNDVRDDDDEDEDDDDDERFANRGPRSQTTKSIVFANEVTAMDERTTGGLEKRVPARDHVLKWAHRLQDEWMRCEPVLTEESEQALTLLKGRLPYEFYRDRLEKFYEQHNPEKLDMIDQIMDAWEGKEDELLRAVVDKYKKQVQRDEAEKMLDQIHGKGVGVDEFGYARE
jgi:hypothetical protein